MDMEKPGVRMSEKGAWQVRGAVPRACFAGQRSGSLWKRPDNKKTCFEYLQTTKNFLSGQGLIARPNGWLRYPVARLSIRFILLQLKVS